MKTIHTSLGHPLTRVIIVLTIVLANWQSATAACERKFYLTKNLFDGAHILNACAKGYHTASLWEIFNVTDLRYDTTLGSGGDDSGSGPPSGGPGWIRTGYTDSLSSTFPGEANCFAWTSNSASDNGTLVYLDPYWIYRQYSPPQDPWVADIEPCSEVHLVWCAQD
jgi:hypothetical protein